MLFSSKGTVFAGCSPEGCSRPHLIAPERAPGEDDSSKGGKRMKLIQKGKEKWEEGKVGWALLWLIGVPVPVLLILFLLRGCT